MSTRSLKLFFLEHLGFVPDSLMLRIQYLIRQKKILHLKNPVLFTEKIQWLKLNNRKEKYHQWVDKVSVKKYVSEVVGAQYVIPTLGVWDKFENISFEELPNSFVLKTNVGGGGLNVAICKSKHTFDYKSAREKLKLRTKVTKNGGGREWPYSGIRTCVFAEELMQNENEDELKDYKFYCFNGEPLYCQVIKGRGFDETIDFYDTNWVHQDFIGLNPKTRHCDNIEEKPVCYDEMLYISKRLSQGQPFLRVDLYVINDKPFFGELTFFPASGYGTFRPEIWDKKLGDLVNLDLLS